MVLTHAVIGIICFVLGWAMKQVPLKDALLDKWRDRSGSMDRIERLLRLKRASDDLELGFPLELLRELEANGFVDHSWVTPFDRHDDARLFCLLCLSVAEKSFLLSCFVEAMGSGYGGCSGKTRAFHRRRFQTWWKVLRMIKDTDTFRSGMAQLGDVVPFLELMESYASYCEAPSRRAFTKWEKAM